MEGATLRQRSAERDTAESGANKDQLGGDDNATGRAMSILDACVHTLSLRIGEPMRSKVNLSTW